MDERKKLIELSIDMFLLNVRMREWIEWIEPITVGDLQPESLSDAKARIDKKIETLMKASD